MLEQPDLTADAVAHHVRAAYGLTVVDVEQLTAGADSQVTTYRLDATEGRYFLKLRNSPVDAANAELVVALAEVASAVVAPLRSRDGDLVTGLGGCSALLYPYFEGRNGFEVALAEDQWVALGASLRTIHQLELPPELRAAVRVETYAPTWRDRSRRHLAQCEHRRPADAVARELLRILVAKRNHIQTIIARAEELAAKLRDLSLPLVLCHGDIHAGNVLVGDLHVDGRVAIVDWDYPVMAPKERDLMFIGGAVGGVWGRTVDPAAFHEGYGSALFNQVALAYYRYERIVADVAEFCDYLLISAAGGIADRALSLRYFTDQFEPGNVVDLADESYARLGLT